MWWRFGLIVMLASPLAMGATFNLGGSAQDSQDLIAKLSRDINKVDHSIEVTKDLIKSSADAPYIANLVFRLAELYVERSRYVYARVMEMQPAGQASLGGEQSLEVKISKRLAIETYEKILKEFPKYNRNDQVRFFRAHEFRELGEWETMIKAHRELIQKHPRSDWAVEARLILGDYYFDKGQIEDAQKYYLQILALPEGHLHDMSRYKMGWIRINQERFKDSLKLFQAAVVSRAKKKRGAIGDAKNLNVKREAMVAMVWPFSEVRKAPQAPEFFRKLADSKTVYVQVLKRLANRYYIKTKYVNAALLYREIVKLSADVEENVEFVQRIYESVRNMSKKNPRRFSHAAEDVKAIVQTVARFETHWKFSSEDKGRLGHDFELRARDLATRLHVQAQRKKDASSARVAADAYRRYLSLFQDAKERKTVQTNRAEALFQSKNYLEAARQYEEVADKLQEGPEQQDILYSSIVAFHRALDEDSIYRAKHPTKRGMLDKLQVLRAREGLKQLGAYYVKTWPKGKNIDTVKFNVAKMYYQQGDYERAAELFSAFVREYPAHKETGTAGRLALNALHKLDEFDKMAALADEFVGNKQISDSAFKNEAAKIGKASRQRKVELTVMTTAAGDFSERMLDEWEKHKGSKEGEEYLYTAFVKYKSEGNVVGVFDFGGRIIGAYPQSKRLMDVIATMGSFAMRAADFDRAAFLFEEYFKRYSSKKNARDLLASAADIRYFLGDTAKAAASYRILRQGGSDKQRLEANQKLIEIHRQARDWPGLGRAAQAALQGNPSWVGGVAYLGLSYAEQAQDDQALRELQKATQLQAYTAFDKEAKARAFFEVGRLLQKRFDSISFRDAASAEQVLGQKMQLQQVVEQAFVGAISAGHGTWAIAALQQVAGLYQRMGEFIPNAPMPQGLTAGEVEQYRAALAENGEAYLAKAAETIKACAKKAEQLKVFTAFASACLAGGLDPVVTETTRQRAPASGDDAFRQEVAQLQGRLAKTPESLPVLKQMARRAIGVGDFHLAKLTLSKAVEVNPRDPEVQNLLGVAEWSLGSADAAYEAFSQARKGRNRQAAFNLAALYLEYGYTRQAKRLLREAGDPASVDLSSPDVHPAVERLP